MKQRKLASSLILTATTVAIALQGCNPGSTLAPIPNSTDGGAQAVGGGGGSAATVGGGGGAATNGGTNTTTDGGAKATGGAISGSGTGGTPGVGTGGTPGLGTGGTKSATGGNIAVATGGNPPSATGGNPPTATGGNPPMATGGNPPAATGGTPVTTATGGAPAATTCTFASTGALSVSSSALVADGTCGGYAYTFASKSAASGAGAVTVSPTCTSTGCTPAFSATALCASGSVGAASDSGSVGGLGFNIFQSGSGTPQGLVLTGTSLVINVTNTGASPLRAQITTAATATSTTSFCYDISGKSGAVTIPLTSFNTACWAPATGTAFSASSPVFAVQLIVPSTTTAATAFNMCLNSVTTS